MTLCANIRLPAAACLLAMALAGCTTSSGGQDEGLSRLMSAPDKFVLFNCDQLVIQATGLAVREQELQRLMAKAGDTPDGRLVSAMAYRTEYITVHGDLLEVRRASAAKNCKPLPAVIKPGTRASDTIVR